MRVLHPFYFIQNKELLFSTFCGTLRRCRRQCDRQKLTGSRGSFSLFSVIAEVAVIPSLPILLNVICWLFVM